MILDNMLNKWNYDPEGEVCYGQEIVYQKARDFLGDSVEDWGCGTAWAKRYFKDYKGIDGSLSIYTKEVTDLIKYKSSVDNILLRQVLEHNYDWKKILDNAKRSFRKKLCITIHTSLSSKTNIVTTGENGIPDISFKKSDILNYLKEFKVSEEFVPTAPFEYGLEWIIYVEKV
jgi:hypothetical protein